MNNIIHMLFMENGYNRQTNKLLNLLQQPFKEILGDKLIQM